MPKLRVNKNEFQNNVCYKLSEKLATPSAAAFKNGCVRKSSIQTSKQILSGILSIRHTQTYFIFHFVKIINMHIVCLVSFVSFILPIKILCDYRYTFLYRMYIGEKRFQRKQITQRHDYENGRPNGYISICGII